MEGIGTVVRGQFRRREKKKKRKEQIICNLPTWSYFLCDVSTLQLAMPSSGSRSEHAVMHYTEVEAWKLPVGPQLNARAASHDSPKHDVHQLPGQGRYEKCKR
jgi:hypothetical protein